jgi:predicted nucleic acid-binding protein
VILVDTSIWVEHLRVGHGDLERALERGHALAHPWVTGELALGGASSGVLRLLTQIPHAAVATDDEVLALITREQLAGAGIGWVDAGLLASARLTPDARLLTDDRKLAGVAARLGVG